MAKSSTKAIKGGLMYSSTGDKIFDTFNYIILFIIMALVLYPLVFVLSASVSDP